MNELWKTGWCLAAGMGLALISSAIEHAIRIDRMETRAINAENEAQLFKNVVHRQYSERADLLAKIHNLEWRLNATKEES